MLQRLKKIYGLLIFVPVPANSLKNTCAVLQGVSRKRHAGFFFFYNFVFEKDVFHFSILSNAWLIVSSDIAKHKRTCPSPPGPNAPPGTTTTPASFKRRIANAYSSVSGIILGKR